jgi:hypothetical protein
MRTIIVDHYGARLQQAMFHEVNAHPVVACLGIIPIALLDVAIDTMRYPLRAIECVAMAIINLLGAVFTSNCEIKDALIGLESGLAHGLSVIGAVAMAPLKVLYQIFAIALSPSTVKSIDYFPGYATMEMGWVVYPDTYNA